MKTLFIVTVSVIVTLTITGLSQNYFNSLASCTKYQSSATMYGYDCQGTTYYTN